MLPTGHLFGYASRSVTAQELQERIAAFPRWDYRFQFDHGIETPLQDRGRINRQEQRRHYFFEPLLDLTGGSLRGRRVLDLGCNAGFWALQAIEAQADFVCGVDLRRDYVEQAQLVFEAKDVDPSRYSFREGDVFACELGDGFDLVLCLGLLAHVCKPVELFELMAGTGAELIVIDTEVSRARSSLFEVSRLYNTNDVAGDGLVLVPSRAALTDLAARFGFATVPLALSIGESIGMGDYRRRRRLAFICSKALDLSELASEERQSRVPWWLRDPRALTSV